MIIKYYIIKINLLTKLFYHNFILLMAAIETAKQYASYSQPMMMNELNINEDYEWHFVDYSINAIFLPLFVTTEILDKKDNNHNGLSHILNMHNINHRLCSGESIQAIQNQIYDNWHTTTLEDVGGKCTLVPYKLVEKTMTQKNI